MYLPSIQGVTQDFHGFSICFKSFLFKVGDYNTFGRIRILTHFFYLQLKFLFFFVFGVEIAQQIRHLIIINLQHGHFEVIIVFNKAVLVQLVFVDDLLEVYND